MRKKSQKWRGSQSMRKSTSTRDSPMMRGNKKSRASRKVREKHKVRTSQNPGQGLPRSARLKIVCRRKIKPKTDRGTDDSPNDCQ